MLFLRNDVKPLYSVSFPDNYPNLPIQACESSGQETIYNFVEGIFKQPGNKRRKPHLERMVFFNSNGECLNVGLPVGVLSTKETYECHFKEKNSCSIQVTGIVSMLWKITVVTGSWATSKCYVQNERLLVASAIFQRSVLPR